jgi:translation initiation factor IF-1
MTETENKEREGNLIGTVSEALPNTLFRVDLERGGEVLAYLSGRMRMHRIKVLIGDRVVLDDNPYGGKLRITKRL